MFLAISAIVCY